MESIAAWCHYCTEKLTTIERGFGTHWCVSFAKGTGLRK